MKIIIIIAITIIDMIFYLLNESFVNEEDYQLYINKIERNKM